MTVQDALMQRAGGTCELCSSGADLAAYDAGNDAQALLCGTCRSGVAAPAAVDVTHWHCLRESMWSEHDVVKVVTYRVLKGLAGVDWAEDLLGQMYLDESVQAWADAGLAADVADNDATAVRVVDSNGTVLSAGDTVSLIKDLEVKGAGFTAKRGTVVKGIALTDDPKYVEGRVNGVGIVLVAAFLKKA